MASRRLFMLLALALVTSCAAEERLFPLASPVSRDDDLRSVRVRCRAKPTPKDPNHTSCAPEPVETSLVWDGADNLVFRPLAETLGVVTSGEAVDVNSLDEVPDSSWFTNRLGARPATADEVRLGDCRPDDFLDGEGAGDGTWIVDKGKTGGSTDGFRVTIPGKGKYLFKADDTAESEHTSGAQVVGALAYRAAGYYATCEQVVYFKPSVLKLTPGLRWRHNLGKEQPFDQRALEQVLAHCPQRAGRVRMEASAWLPGYAIGAFEYEGTRADDPSDVIAHEDRRELRGMRLLAAWLDRFDTRSGNTLDVWVSDARGAPDGSPGHVVHHQMDTSECLGSEWNWDEISRRLGFSYVFDWGDMARDFATLGIPARPWDTAHHEPGRELFGYFNVQDFTPEEWKNEYPVAAFSRMTERDGAWMARILARFTPEMVHAIIERARFTDPGDAAFVERTLAGRLAKILERYLTRLSPIAGVHVEGAAELCGVDLAEERGLRPADEFRFTARVLGRGWLPVERRAGAQVCVTLPHVAGDGGAPDAARERYVSVRLEDGVARGPLVAHLYDLGPARGFTLAGLERPE